MTARHRQIWLAGCALIMAVALFQFAQVASGAVPAASLGHRDFANLWTGGRLILLGDWPRLYDTAAFTAQQTQWVGSFGRRVFAASSMTQRLEVLVQMIAWGASISSSF